MFFDQIAGFLFPTSCIICGTEGPDLCQGCLGHFGAPKPSNYDWIVSLWNYHDPHVETMMRHIKNNPNLRMMRQITPIMRMKLSEAAQDRASPFSHVHRAIIIPIPIGRARYRSRGYNQSLLLARPLTHLMHRKIVAHVLVKSRTTKKQGTTKNRAERLANIKNSFAISRAAADCVRGRDIILVDDITTTGSTLVEARETLLRAGARNVVAITVAN